MGFAWWIWIVLGFALLLAELLTVGFFFMWFALGALIVGVLSGIFPLPLTTQLVLWSLSSIAMTALWFLVLKNRFMPAQFQIGQSAGNIVGEVGLTVTDIHPFKRGAVRFQQPLLGSEIWQCFSDDDIAAGQRVKVVSVEGNLLKVALISHEKEKNHA